jgi:hypothetical protein
MGKYSAMRQRGQYPERQRENPPDAPGSRAASVSLNDRIESVNAMRHRLALKYPRMHDRQRFAALDWEDVHFFAALARHRTLPATARALKVTPEAVEHRLTRLEALLGYPLFTQTGREYELNAAGCAALAEAAQMEMAACSLLQKQPAVTS